MRFVWAAIPKAKDEVVSTRRFVTRLGKAKKCNDEDALDEHKYCAIMSTFVVADIGSSLDDPARVVFRDPPPQGGAVRRDGDDLFIINAARGTPMSYRGANGVRREQVVSELTYSHFRRCAICAICFLIPMSSVSL